MKIAIIGQQDFGKAVLEAFLARGDEVAGVFCAPEKPGAKADPHARGGGGEGAQGLPVQVAARHGGARSAAGAERRHRHHGVRAAVRAAGLRATSRSTARSSTTRRCCRSTAAPRRSTGRSSAATRRPASPSSAPPTASTKARWCCRRRRRSGPTTRWAACTSTACSRMGVQAMLEAADLVMAGKHKEIVQDESQATYEGWCRAAEAKLNWAQPRRLRLQHYPRLQPGARGVDHVERQERRRSSTARSIPCARSAR